MAETLVYPTHPIIKGVWEKARAAKKAIVLPETEDERTYFAAEWAMKEGLASRIVLVGPEGELKAKAKAIGADISACEIEDPTISANIDKKVARFVEIRKGKISTEDAYKLLTSNYLYYGCIMVKDGEVDGQVAGASHTSADVIRSSYQIVKTAPGITTASSYMIMLLPEHKKEYGEEGLLIFADCGANQDPDAAQLADIAITSCLTAKNILGIEARCALLSHSTKGSAAHAMIDKVLEAAKIANEKRPDLLIDAEYQADAALVPSVGQKKAPGSAVAGKANILVFPNLDAGNIGYKLVERLADAEAYGPLMQGLDKPCMDLSRGCKASDIANVIAICAVKALYPYG